MLQGMCLEELAGGTQRSAAARRTQIEHEVADAAMRLRELPGMLGIDLPESVQERLRTNARRLPVEKARGSSRKYDERTDR